MLVDFKTLTLLARAEGREVLVDLLVPSCRIPRTLSTKSYQGPNIHKAVFPPCIPEITDCRNT